jgi:hypothetical protein
MNLLHCTGPRFVNKASHKLYTKKDGLAPTSDQRLAWASMGRSVPKLSTAAEQSIALLKGVRAYGTSGTVHRTTQDHLQVGPNT